MSDRERRPLDGLRRREALRLGAGAAGLTILATVSTMFQAQRYAEKPLSGKLFPGFATIADNAASIHITVKAERYSLIRGKNDAWNMPERGGFPVAIDPLNALAKGLTEITLLAEKTRDPARLDALGLGDPRQGGTGALLDIRDATGKTLVTMILGFRPSGIYARRPTETIAYAVKGDLPPLQQAGAWLDLGIFNLAAERIVRVTALPLASPGYTLARSPRGDFSLADPPAMATNPNPTNRTALALTRWRPIDVAPLATTKGQVSGTLDTVTLDGLAVRATAIEAGNRFWITLGAAALLPARTEEAEALNARAAGWAFEFTRYDWVDWVTPLAEISAGADRPPGP